MDTFERDGGRILHRCFADARDGYLPRLARTILGFFWSVAARFEDFNLERSLASAHLEGSGDAHNRSTSLARIVHDNLHGMQRRGDHGRPKLRSEHR